MASNAKSSVTFPEQPKSLGTRLEEAIIGYRAAYQRTLQGEKLMNEAQMAYEKRLAESEDAAREWQKAKVTLLRLLEEKSI